MRLDPPPRPERPEAVAPMINVVFLLLIFFVMSATLTPPEALEAEPPEARREGEAPGPAALVIDASGQTAFGRIIGPAAIAAAAAEDGPARVRADAAAPAKRVVAVLNALKAAGAQETRLIVTRSRE